MVKVEEIKIRGYKNIESAELRLGAFNVVIGPNNSGKSNFIQVFSFLNYIINSSLDELEKVFQGGFSMSHFKEIIPAIPVNKMLEFKRTGSTSFELTFSNSTTNRVFTYCLDIEWSTDFFKNEYKIKTESLEVKQSNKPGKSVSIFNRNYSNVKYGVDFSKMDVVEKIPDHFSVVRVLKILAEVKEDYKDAIDSLNEIIKTPIFYFSHIELLRKDKERINAFNGRVVSFELEPEIIALEESGKWSIFKEAIKDILNIEDVEVYRFGGDPKNDKLPQSKSLLFTHQGKYKSLNDFSDGTVLILALIAKVLSSKSQLFLIEEPENSTHPRALVDLISFIRSFSESSQFIITSHSIAILNKTKVEDIIASTINQNGSCELININSRKDLKNKLRRSSVNFSDELFFNIDEDAEFD